MAIITAPPLNFQERIRSALMESLELSYWDLVPAAVHLRATLSDSNDAEGFDFYRVEGGVSFMVYEIHPHLAMNTISDETTETNANGTYLSIAGARNRELLKALNCDITLINPDRESMQYFVRDGGNSVDGQGGLTLPLSALYSELGGGPLVFAEGVDIVPMIVNENDRIEMTATLRSTGTTWNTNAGFSTEYGVTLMGVFLRARATN